MNAMKPVFVTPLAENLVEVDTDELYELGQSPHRVEGDLAAAARFVARRYPERRPVLLLDRDAGSVEADEMMRLFEQAWGAALRPCEVG